MSELIEKKEVSIGCDKTDIFAHQKALYPFLHDSTLTLGDVIYSILMQLGWSQSQLAKNLGVSRSAVHQYINNVKRPRREKILQILRICERRRLKIDAGYFLI